MIDEVRDIAVSQLSLTQQTRIEALLDKNTAGTLTSAEKEELVGLRTQADRLMLRKAYAWAVLRWRGQPVPALHGQTTST
jgi:hypothetical protein